VATFARPAAVIVGSVNLALLAGVFEADSSLRRGEVEHGGEALVPSLAVLLAWLASAEIVLRKLGPLVRADGFYERFAAVLVALSLGGTFSGGLLAALWHLDGTLYATPTSIYYVTAGTILVVLLGIVLGGGLGVIEGLILAFSLAAVLGLSGRGG
jgi:hypothetical protein